MIEILLLLGAVMAVAPLLSTQDQNDGSETESNEEEATDDGEPAVSDSEAADLIQLPDNDEEQRETPEQAQSWTAEENNDDSFNRTFTVFEDVAIRDFDPEHDRLHVEIDYTATEVTELFQTLGPIDASWFKIELSEETIDSEASTRVSIVQNPLPSIEWDSSTDAISYGDQGPATEHIFGELPTILIQGVAPNELSLDAVLLTVRPV